MLIRLFVPFLFLSKVSKRYYITALGSRWILVNGNMGSSQGRAMPQLLYQQDPIRTSVRSLGARWTLLIVRDIGFLKLSRFSEILRNNPGLTARVLSRRLKDMQKEGLIERKATRDAIKYSLTPRGEDAVFILLAFLRYGLKHHTGEKLASSKPLPSLEQMIQQYRQLPLTKSREKR
jgi:DNA-binding HxlR family transcriptional regulator